MSLSLHTIKPTKGSKTKHQRRGRGNASGNGTYSGRGQKGQRSRSGGKGGLKLLGLRKNILSSPKYRGMKSHLMKFQVINLEDLEKNFGAGETVTKKMLEGKGLIRKNTLPVKLLGTGKLTKKMIVELDACSTSARLAIEGNGGNVVVTKK